MIDTWKSDFSLCLRGKCMKIPTLWTSTQRSLPACLLKWNMRYSKTWKSFPKDAGPCTTNLQRYLSFSFTWTRSYTDTCTPLNIDCFSLALSVQETFPSTSWPACCRGTSWTSVWRVLRKRWASGAPAAPRSSTNRTGNSRVTTSSHIDWFQKTIPTISLLKVTVLKISLFFNNIII